VSHKPEQSVFYGHPCELIAEWCRVPVEEAQAWKAGTLTPSPGAIALFQLHAEGRVLTEEFKGYVCRKGKLVPNGRLGFTPAQLEAYELVYMIAMTNARPEVEAHLERMKLALRDPAPEVGTARLPLPRWVWDPFFNPREGARTVSAGTHHDDKRGV
jgi:hypothetical protein